MIDAPVSVEQSKKKQEQKRQAMLRKIKSLGMGNPIVKGVVKEKKKDPDKTYDQWQPVRLLSSEAFEQFREGDLSFEKAVVSLASALFKLAGKAAENKAENEKE